MSPIFSPKLDAVIFIRQLAPLLEGAPDWIRNLALKVFSINRRIRELLETISILDKRSKEIYADKKRALEMGDAEMLKQVGQGKDIISILRTFAHYHTSPGSNLLRLSSCERGGRREG